VGFSLVPLLLEAEDDGVNPEAAGAGFADSTDAFSTVFGVKRFDSTEGTEEGFVPLMALANMLDVDVVVGCKLGVGAADWDIAVAGASLPRARLVGEGSGLSKFSSLTFRFVDKAVSLPVIPLVAARCFLASSIFFLMSRACW